jgi:para-nitrobenzyl esterase
MTRLPRRFQGRAIGRRSFCSLVGASAVLQGAGLGRVLGRDLPHPLRAQDAGAANASAAGAVVETATGRIRGLRQNGVHVFKGVPYGASTAGAARFMPPSPPRPWTGVRDTVSYGPRAPQPFRPMIPEIGDALTGTGPMDEDCLRLNVWTPAIGRGTRPVMVWFHGGGFRTGSGNSAFYDGAELARKHDVVVVTVTHRLNAFGFLYLAAVGGDRYARSSNVGMPDLVLALEWVRDHIAAFGGNPDNVTTFGQSGGGGKTSILLGMPSAKGLFHRAIIMSPLADTAITALEPSEAAAATELLLARLDVRPNRLDVLHEQPMARILAAVTGGTGSAGGQAGRPAPTGDLSLRFTPVVDGRTLAVHPFSPGASALAATIPILCGSNETEGVPYAVPDAPYWRSAPTDIAALRARAKEILPVDDAEADRLIAVYRASRPTESFGDLAAVMAGDTSPLRLSSYTIAERTFARGTAPARTVRRAGRSPPSWPVAPDAGRAARHGRRGRRVTASATSRRVVAPAGAPRSPRPWRPSRHPSWPPSVAGASTTTRLVHPVRRSLRTPTRRTRGATAALVSARGCAVGSRRPPRSRRRPAALRAFAAAPACQRPPATRRRRTRRRMSSVFVPEHGPAAAVVQDPGWRRACTSREQQRVW